MLRFAEAARHAARSASERNRARLRVGYVPDVLPSSVPRALQALTAAGAGIEIALETGTPLGLIAGVRDGAVDAAVVSLPAATKGLRVTTLEAQPLIVALPAAHARAFDDAVALEQLDPERLIVLQRAANPALHDAVVSLCRAAGVAPALVEAAAPRVEAVLLAVAAGGGAALLPRSVGDRYAVPGVRLIELLGVGPTLESAVVTRPDVEHLSIQAFLRAVTYAATAARIGAGGVNDQRLRRRGDSRARSELAARYLPLARSLALRYRHTQEPIEDLVQVASLGLVKAIDLWDPDRGTPLASYAVPTILGELRRHFRDQTWLVKPPRSMQELVLQLVCVARGSGARRGASRP